MRLLLFLGVLAVIGLIVTGAITLQRSADDTITIKIDRTRVRQDAATVVEKGKDVLEGAGDRFREAARETDTR